AGVRDRLSGACGLALVVERLLIARAYGIDDVRTRERRLDLLADAGLVAAAARPVGVVAVVSAVTRQACHAAARLVLQVLLGARSRVGSAAGGDDDDCQTPPGQDRALRTHRCFSCEAP